MSRWTSADPSGFPDGANNQILAGAPTLGFDPTGLAWTITASIDNTNKTNTSSGTVGWLDPSYVDSTSDLNTSIPTSTPGVASGTVTGVGLADLNDGSEYDETQTLADFNVSVDSNGNITIVPTDTSWTNFAGNVFTGYLGIASTYSIIGSGSTVTLTYSTSAQYNGSGPTGAGLMGASITWSSGTSSPVGSGVSITFTAQE
jgi:hypothetical protein